MANEEKREKAEDSEGTTPGNPGLSAYLETLCYHTETFNALRELQSQVGLLTSAIDVLHGDLQVLLRRTRGKGLYGGDAREQAAALSQPARKKGFKVKKESTA